MHNLLSKRLSQHSAGDLLHRRPLHAALSARKLAKNFHWPMEAPDTRLHGLLNIFATRRVMVLHLL